MSDKDDKGYTVGAKAKREKCWSVLDWVKTLPLDLTVKVKVFDPLIGYFFSTSMCYQQGQGNLSDGLE